MQEPGAPPRAERPHLLRARLLERLQRRWSVPVVAVIAGAGFGKTTLLAQTLAENLLDPRGVDHWLSCTPEDSGAATLSGHIAGALGLPQSHAGEITPSDMADAIAARAPLHVAILLDDAHLIDNAGEGARLLSEFISSLPSNGHVVMAGRPPLPIGVARLRAQGRVATITEAEMAFNETESAAFAALRVADPKLVANAAGWPALAELHAAAEREATLEFLWDELLGTMSAERRRHLAVLSAIGRADDRLLSAACGTGVSVREVVRNLPLSTVTSDGWAVLHDLWSPALVAILKSEERDHALERAARLARSNERLIDAFRFFAEASRWDEARSIVRHACASSHPLVASETLERWHDQLLASARACPEVTLLQGVIIKQTAPDDAVLCLRRAAEAYRAGGLRDEEASCLFHLGHLFWWADRTDELMALVERVEELAGAGSWLATSMMELGAVLLGAPSNDDPLKVSVTVDGRSEPLHPEIVPLRCWLLARNQLFAGDIVQALLSAEASVKTATPTMRAVSEFLELQCRWASGAADGRRHVLESLDSTLDAVRREGWLHFTVADLAQAAMWVAVCGQHERAAAYLLEARTTPQRTSAWSDALIGLAEVVLAVAGGDDRAASRLIDDELRRRPLEDPSADLAHRPWLTISYVLAPESRTHWERAELGGSHRLARTVARALTACREVGKGASSEAAAALPIAGPADIERIRSFLPAPWLAELAALMEGAKRSDVAAELLTDAPAETRTRLSLLARTSPRHLAECASALLKTVARSPAQDVSLDVLGPLRLRFDDVERWPPEMNRRVVRDLLLLLVEHRCLTREQIVARQWPDAVDSAGRASLRNTLSLLNKALEPRRAEGEAPFFLTEQGEQIRLDGGTHLSIDSDRFETALHAGKRAEAQSAVTTALDHWLEATDLYRGDYAADAGSAGWVLATRERFRVQFVNAAVRAGSLLVARGDAERAVELATRAIAAEPWSEPARTLLGEAYLQLGDLSSARRAVEHCDAMLAGLGVDGTETLAMLRRRLTC